MRTRTSTAPDDAKRVTMQVSTVGIVCNAALTVFKLVAGIVAHSVGHSGRCRALGVRHSRFADRDDRRGLFPQGGRCQPPLRARKARVHRVHPAGQHPRARRRSHRLRGRDEDRPRRDAGCPRRARAHRGGRVHRRERGAVLVHDRGGQTHPLRVAQGRGVAPPVRRAVVHRQLCGRARRAARRAHPRPHRVDRHLPVHLQGGLRHLPREHRPLVDRRATRTPLPPCARRCSAPPASCVWTISRRGCSAAGRMSTPRSPVDGALPLRDAHVIAEAVHHELECDYPDVKHCTVHVNPA